MNSFTTNNSASMNVNKQNIRSSIIAQFFDNEIHHIAKFQSILPGIESIHIDDTTPNEKLVVDNYAQYLSLKNRTKVYCDHSDFLKNQKIVMLQWSLVEVENV